MGTLQKPEPGDEFPMSYEDFHCMLEGTDAWDPHVDEDPCEALFGYGAPTLTWPALSYLPSGDMYTDTWMYDHLRGVAVWGTVGAWIEDHEDAEETDEEECLS